MGFQVRYSDHSITTSAGFGMVARVPFILDGRPGYHRLGSRYLIDRALGRWSPRARVNASKPSNLTEVTVKNYAHWLCNFLEWTEARKIQPESCNYSEHIYTRYQKEMMQGTWSASGKGLSAATVNARVQQACDYLTWMADKGERAGFDVPVERVKIKVESAKNSCGERLLHVDRRVGRVRENKRRLRMPGDKETLVWLESVYKRNGQTLGLVCETILLTGLRLEEVASLRTETLPEDRGAWHITNLDAPKAKQLVLVSVRFGAKGPSFGEDHGDKIGPERCILIPLYLAEKIDSYRKCHRNGALKKWIDAAADRKEKLERIKGAVHLFLNEKMGKRVTGDNIYRSWKNSDLPFPAWSPHLGRDWWACSILLKEMECHERFKELGPAYATELLESTCMAVIRLRIQPQLGHQSEATTLIYLQWIADRFGVSLSIAYDASFEDDVSLLGSAR